MARLLAKKVKSYPAPGQQHLYQWKSTQYMSPAPVTCSGCQQSGLFWSWNFRLGRPCLIDPNKGYAHECATPNKQDVFPGWCLKCNAPDLSWIRKQNGFELTENYGLPHTCEQEKTITEMSAGKCRICNTSGLFWIQVDGRFSLVDSVGTKHTCAGYGQYLKDWAEAKRMNYAVEKAWINSHADDDKCKKCKGKGHVEFLSKSKKNKQKYGSTESILMHRPCLKCKRIGTFTLQKKYDYLKDLRKRYWPFRGGVHKWKKYDNLGE